MLQDTEARKVGSAEPLELKRSVISPIADCELDGRLVEAAERLSLATKAVAIILFGSRARGSGHQWSDWDLCVVLPDDAPAAELTPFHLRPLTSDLGIPIDVVTMRLGVFKDCVKKPGSLSAQVARDGKVILGRTGTQSAVPATST